jgi:hypothetical protein
MRYLMLIVWFLPIAATAQFNISFNTGIATFTMSDLKNSQMRVQNSLPVKAKVISSFPAFWIYNGNMKWIFDNGIIIGADGSYTSTGGRVYYSDYSGKIIYDQTLIGYSVSTFIGKAFKLKDESLTLQCYLMVGTTYTKYEDQYSEQSEPNESYGLDLSGSSHFLQPVVNLSKRFGFVAANINVGYYQTAVPGNLSASFSGTQQSNDYSFTADWSGLRLGCGASFYFSGRAVK